MKIGEASRQSGLSKKNIRFYESKGLLRVQRTDNDYRDYTAQDVRDLQQIRLLRSAGVCLSDIRLWQHGIIGTAELMRKRIRELESTRVQNAQQLSICQALAAQPDGVLRFPDALPEIDETEPAVDRTQPVVIGIDLGTTTLSAVVLDAHGAVLESYTVETHAAIPDAPGIQRAAEICRRAEAVAELLVQSYPAAQGIGLCGQMHGIVYVDAAGNAVSDLYTWQNPLGMQRRGSGETWSEWASRVTGTPLSTGYGLVTHSVLADAGTVPAGAVRFCTIMDYLAMRLTGAAAPVMHPSNAASLGLFDPVRNAFRADAAARIGVPASFLPQVCAAGGAVVGTFRGVPVCAAIGDHQSSFLGAVRDPARSMLVNVGTGSQLTVQSTSADAAPPCEVRPLADGVYLHSYSALCGGAAYALLERFFRAVCVQCGGADRPMYDEMAQMASQAHGTLPVCTAFCGTRADPALRGTISGIGMDNFTPQELTRGVLDGIAAELYAHADALRRANPAADRLVGSGNAIRKNPVLQQCIADRFGMALQISPFPEEAAVGAARFAADLIRRASDIS